VPTTIDAETRARLLDPPAEDERAPDEFTIVLETTEGQVLIDVHRAWAPIGADRIYSMVRLGYFDGTAFFRVIEGFMAQVGIHGDAQVNRVWRDRNIVDDPATQSNTRGMVTFAKTGLPNSRSTQFFINFSDNSRLDPMGFAPFGRVRDMAVMDRIYAGYGEGAPSGRGPAQARAQAEGNRYFRAEFPELDYIVTARILEE
jgi:peptidyl-prolyl cis-trans isomerase A (cyclophilin A)